MSEVIYHNAPKDLNLLSPRNPWIYGEPPDLDDIHFNERWTWSSMFRAVLIMSIEDEEVTFHLSGVGELRQLHHIALPRDENKMMLWNHRGYIHQVHPIINFASILYAPQAFNIHERCWQLMIRILDVELIKRNMDIFVRAMCEPQLDMSIRPALDGIHVSPEVKEWLNFACRLAPRFHPNLRTFRAMNDGDPSHMRRHFRGADPLNDSYIQNVIARYTTKYAKKREKGREPTWQPSIPTHTMSRRSQAGFTPRKVLLPTELILSIADYLENLRDIRIMLSVFPHWHTMMPDSYWRRRFIDDNYLENEQFPAEDALDWQYVYLNTDRLLQPSLGWRNRQYILRKLEATKDRFLQRLEQKDIQD
ncbi:hypothetical protein N7463_003205 [Penicillium fimorum]|uniref:F-box domain-containing protein n=1 Tax=Penicillium fimorum TaxID=1882269 RepID=A0A9W9Y0N5_9EURO|nr:hypothetical protein N7463_003205 [Penicillium fimorum]